MGELRVDPEHAGSSDGPLVLKIPIHQGSQVEAAKVPDCVKDVVHRASDRVIRPQDYKQKGKNQSNRFNGALATYCRKILR